MKLQFNGNDVKGTEYYDKQKEKNTLLIKGTIDEKGNLVLYEYDNLIGCGTFEGVLKDDTYSGIFTNSRGRSMSFSAQVVKSYLLKKEMISDNDAVNINSDDKERCFVTYLKLLDRFSREMLLADEKDLDAYTDANYFLYDITGDGLPELWLIKYGTCAINTEIEVYTYDKKSNYKTILIKNATDCGYYKGKGYILERYAKMGDACWTKLTFNGKKIVETTIFKDSLNDDEMDDEGYRYKTPSEKYIELYPYYDEGPIKRAFRLK